MGRFQSAVHNIGHHAVSGLCNILAEGYVFCEREGREILKIDLLNSNSNASKELDNEIRQLREKAVSIITTTSGTSINNIQVAELSINYRFNEKAYQLRKAHMENIGVWYGHDPLYDAVLICKLKNGRVSKSEFSNRNVPQYAKKVVNADR